MRYSYERTVLAIALSGCGLSIRALPVPLSLDRANSVCIEKEETSVSTSFSRSPLHLVSDLPLPTDHALALHLLDNITLSQRSHGSTVISRQSCSHGQSFHLPFSHCLSLPLSFHLVPAGGVPAMRDIMCYIVQARISRRTANRAADCRDYEVCNRV